MMGFWGEGLALAIILVRVNGVLWFWWARLVEWD
jgi:hypothetical protein